MPENDWQDNRRKFLQAAASAGLIGLAGCTGGDGTETPTETDPGSSGGGDTDTQTAMPKQGGSLKFAQTSSPVELDPSTTTAGTTPSC